MKRLLAAIVVLLGAISLPLVLHASPVLRVGELSAIRIGETFTVPVRITDAVDLKAFQFDLVYNALVLEAIGVSDSETDFEAAAIAGGGSLTGLTGFLFSGTLSGVADSMSGVLDGLYGSGVLATIEFRSIGLGISQLALSNAFIDFVPLAAESMVNGEVVVSEPGELWLALLALACLAWGPRPSSKGASNRQEGVKRSNFTPGVSSQHWRST